MSSQNVFNSTQDSHHSRAHAHMHSTVDPSIITSKRGIWAIEWSFAGLLATALFHTFGERVVSEATSMYVSFLHM